MYKPIDTNDISVDKVMDILPTNPPNWRNATSVDAIVRRSVETIIYHRRQGIDRNNLLADDASITLDVVFAVFFDAVQRKYAGVYPREDSCAEWSGIRESIHASVGRLVRKKEMIVKGGYPFGITQKGIDGNHPCDKKQRSLAIPSWVVSSLCFSIFVPYLAWGLWNLGLPGGLPGSIVAAVAIVSGITTTFVNVPKLMGGQAPNDSSGKG